MITVITFRVGQPPCREAIPDTLEAMQEIVGGYLEKITIGPGVGLFSNEEGKQLQLVPNIVLTGGTVLLGNCFISRWDFRGKTIDVTDKDFAASQAIVRYSRINIH